RHPYPGPLPPGPAKPHDPAHTYVSQNDIDVLCVLATDRSFSIPHTPTAMIIPHFVTLTGDLAPCIF
ncbi:MAG: hypothetical protein OXC53_07880, partial [Rhodobacteraceae bacterium]|nr:hypothetical protein [Paracoccaceae bacterium]